jgi:hypothetical protein
MDFDIVGCEIFGYDNNMRPTGQVSLNLQHDRIGECLRMAEVLPDVTTKAQVVMFLLVAGQKVNLYSAMLAVKCGVVIYQNETQKEIDHEH